MTNAELLTSFKKYNKKAREIRAKKFGFKSAADYIAFLSGGGYVVPAAHVQPLVVPTSSDKKKAKSVSVGPVPTIHIVDIADKSGSMSGGKDEATVEGINGGVKELQLNKANVKYTHTYCDFSNEAIIVHVAANPNDVSYIRTGTRGMTALWDAIGETVKALEPCVKKDEKVLVNIYTDGEENASHRFTTRSIKELIDDLSKKGWTFTFIGTEKDVDTIIDKVNIHASNTRSYDGTAKGMRGAMMTNSLSRERFVKKVKANEDVSEGYFSKDID
jgi:ribosomal protein S8E